jgi:hypothetical protein
MFVAKLEEAIASKTAFISDRMNFLSLGLAGLLNIIHWVILFIKIKPGKNNILLHYNVVFGPDLVAQSVYLYWIPLLALILLIINVAVAANFYKKEKLAAYFLNVASIAVQVVFFVATLILIMVND